MIRVLHVARIRCSVLPERLFKLFVIRSASMVSEFSAPVCASLRCASRTSGKCSRRTSDPLKDAASEEERDLHIVCELRRIRDPFPPALRPAKPPWPWPRAPSDENWPALRSRAFNVLAGVRGSAVSRSMDASRLLRANRPATRIRSVSGAARGWGFRSACEFCGNTAGMRRAASRRSSVTCAFSQCAAAHGPTMQALRRARYSTLARGITSAGEIPAMASITLHHDRRDPDHEESVIRRPESAQQENEHSQDEDVHHERIHGST